MGSSRCSVLWAAASNRIIPSMLNATDINYLIWIEHSKEDARNTSKDMIKLFFFMTDHMLQNQWRKSWKHLHGYLISLVLFTRRFSFRLSFVSVDAVCYEQRFSYFEDIKKMTWWLDRLERIWIFLSWNPFVILKVGKGYSFRWTILWIKY